MSTAVTPQVPGFGGGGGVVPLTATITADGSQAWPAAVNPTVTPSGGDGSYTYVWTLVADGIDFSARLSATNVANPTFTPQLKRQWVATCTISDGAGQSITKVYTLTVGDAEGWVNLPLTGGTLYDPNGYVQARTATSVTVTDVVDAAGNFPCIHWAAADLIPADARVLSARVVQDATAYANCRKAVMAVGFTNDTANGNLAARAAFAGCYNNAAQHFAYYAFAGTENTISQSAAYYGTQVVVQLDNDQEAVGYGAGGVLDSNGDGVTSSHYEANLLGLAYGAGISIAAMCWSYGVDGSGDKTMSGIWQIRVS